MILHEGDCLGVLRTLDDNSIDAVVTDPPYELGFMGKAWDSTGIANNTALWAEVIRVVKPGGHLASFSGTRTYHRMACAIEDAGFEIRDQLAWTYGQGFPKSHNVGGGWGTALKPAWEPICLARKPLSEPTVAANVLRWGTGAINVDGCRIEASANDIAAAAVPNRSNLKMFVGDGEGRSDTRFDMSSGRWPANLIHDGSQEVLDLFPETGASLGGSRGAGGQHGKFSPIGAQPDVKPGFGDAGSAARFFYCAKASKHDRAGSKHPTVKPIALMQWLCRLLTPPGGTVLDPFAGSGTTGAAALSEGFRCILIEREAEYANDIRRRMGEAAETIAAE